MIGNILRAMNPADSKSPMSEVAKHQYKAYTMASGILPDNSVVFQELQASYQAHYLKFRIKRQKFHLERKPLFRRRSKSPSLDSEGSRRTRSKEDRRGKNLPSKLLRSFCTSRNRRRILSY